MNEEQLREFAFAFLQNNRVNRFLRRLQLPQDERLRDLLDSIRNNRHTKGRYSGLNENMLCEIICQLREQFHDLEDISVGAWNNQQVVDRIAQAHFFVKNQLINKLELKNSSWSIVGQIINFVFGDIPVINNHLKRDMHEAGYLLQMQTTDIKKILSSIRNFYNANQEKIHSIIDKIGELALSGIIDNLPLTFPKNMLISIILMFIHELLFTDWNKGNELK